jgi:hypothetical protein
MLVTMPGLMLVPLLATAGYGVYLRSGMYAASVARRASTFLGTPVQIASVVPLDHASQGFRDVEVWLPGEFDPIFTCKMAIVQMLGTHGTALDLRDGRIDARTDGWTYANLAQVLAMTFAHDFHQIRLESVRLDNMDLVVRRNGTILRISGATGRVDLDGQTARADLLCSGINGMQAAEPIRIHCTFEPGEKPLLRELSLSVQRLGLDAFLPARQRQGSGTQAPESQPGPGWFSGTIAYRQMSRESLAGLVELSGTVADVDLAAFNRQAGKGCLQGTLNGTLDKAVFDGWQVRRLQGRMSLDHLSIKPLLVRVGLAPATGKASLRVHELRYEGGSLQALLAEGEVNDLAIGTLLRPLHWGEITGQMNLRLQKVKVVDNRLEGFAAEARLVPPAAQVGTIDRSIVQAAAERFLHISLPPILPEKILYANLAAAFDTRDNDLYIHGLTGPDGEFVLVGETGSMQMALVPAPSQPIGLGDLQILTPAQVSQASDRVMNWARARLQMEASELSAPED